MKKLIVFDLDGTLAPSKSSLDSEMASQLHDLLGVVRVAVISGGAWLQFERQVLSKLKQDERLANLSILPTCGTQFFQYAGQWTRLYAEDFTTGEKEKIIGSLSKSVAIAGFKVEKTWEKRSRTGEARLLTPRWASRLRWKIRRSGTQTSPSG